MKKSILLSLAFLMITSTGLCAEFSNRGGLLSSATGRFVFGQISEQRRDHYMLDTQTGELWQIVVEENDENKVPKLQPILYDYGEKKVLSPLQIGTPKQPAPSAPGVPKMYLKKK